MFLVKTFVNSSANAYLVRHVYRDVEDCIFFIVSWFKKQESFNKLVVSDIQKLWHNSERAFKNFIE